MSSLPDFLYFSVILLPKIFLQMLKTDLTLRYFFLIIHVGMGTMTRLTPSTVTTVFNVLKYVYSSFNGGRVSLILSTEFIISPFWVGCLYIF